MPESTQTVSDLITILPAVFVAIWAILLLVVDLLFVPPTRKGVTAMLAAVGLAIGLGLCIALFNNPVTGGGMLGFGGMSILDGFAIYADALILISAILGVGVGYDFLHRMKINRGEYYVLMLVSTAGMLLMVHAYDLIVVFLALELLSIPLYVLAGFARPRISSEESALKYFLLGTFSSGFFLYGVALIFGGTATTRIQAIVAEAQGGTLLNPSLFLVGAALLLVGLAFKVSAVPFHMWTPDVYQGAPTPVTAFMSVSVKIAGFGALLRIFVTAFPTLAADLTPILWAVAAATMIIGNLLAVAQTNVKRLLAYSSIAHAGYLLMAFVPYGNGQVVGNAMASMLFYLASYGLTSFAAWGVVIAAERLEERGLDLDDYAGLGRKYPILGLAMMAAMFSFTGIPMTMGFWGKLFVFRAAIEAGSLNLALIGLLTSLISAYYYLRVLVIMYMRPGDGTASQDPWLNLVVGVSAAGVVVLAFFPGVLYDLALRALMLLA
jgi:NADH-quinone oxidoreductase subunit N